MAQGTKNPGYGGGNDGGVPLLKPGEDGYVAPLPGEDGGLGDAATVGDWVGTVGDTGYVDPNATISDKRYHAGDVNSAGGKGGHGYDDKVQYVGDLEGDLPPDAPQYESVAAGSVPGIGAGAGIADPVEPGLLQTNIGETGYKPPQREVQDNELVSSQLNKLLASDSEYMRQAKLQGLEIGGGLGGTSGIRAAMGEAIRNGLPIAEGDAQAYRDAATQNMDVLAQFGLANIQRQTQLQLGNLDAATRIRTTHMNNSTQTAIARLQDATQRDIASLDSATRLRITEMNGEIQGRLAELAFKNTVLLNDQTHGNNLEDIALKGEYSLEQQAQESAVMREINYTNTVLAIYNGALDRLSAMDGMDMDDAARQRYTAMVWEGHDGQMQLMALLYPDIIPINFGNADSDAPPRYTVGLGG